MTEEEFLTDPTICDDCKNWWLKYHTPKAPWVCVKCAELEKKMKGKEHLRPLPDSV